jgi:hypothetical protein
MIIKKLNKKTINNVLISLERSSSNIDINKICVENVKVNNNNDNNNNNNNNEDNNTKSSGCKSDKSSFLLNPNANVFVPRNPIDSRISTNPSLLFNNYPPVLNNNTLATNDLNLLSDTEDIFSIYQTNPSQSISNYENHNQSSSSPSSFPSLSPSPSSSPSLLSSSSSSLLSSSSSSLLSSSSSSLLSSSSSPSSFPSLPPSSSPSQNDLLFFDDNSRLKKVTSSLDFDLNSSSNKKDGKSKRSKSVDNSSPFSNIFNDNNTLQSGEKKFGNSIAPTDDSRQSSLYDRNNSIYFTEFIFPSSSEVYDEELNNMFEGFISGNDNNKTNDIFTSPFDSSFPFYCPNSPL